MTRFARIADALRGRPLCQVMAFAAVTALFLIPANRVTAAEHAVPQIEAIEIDGDEEDWGDQGYWITLFADKSGNTLEPDDFLVTLRLAWDQRGLLCLLNVKDDRAFEWDYDRRLFLGDSIEFFLADDVGSLNYYMALASPGKDSRYPEPRMYFFDHRMGAAGGEENPLTMSIACQDTPTGYRMEVLLPWSNLKLSPQEGRVVGFQLYAMDKDTAAEDEPSFSAIWFPKHDTHMSQTRSMHALRLTSAPSPPVKTAVRVDAPNVSVLGLKEFAGQTVHLTDASGKTIAESTFDAIDGAYVVANLTLPDLSRRSEPSRFGVQLGGVLIETLELGLTQDRLKKAVEDGNLEFKQYIFSGTTLPKPALRDPDVARQLIGPYTIDVSYFDSACRPVTRADEPGPYTAIIDVVDDAGGKVRRYANLYRATDDESIAQLRVSEELLNQLDLPGGGVFDSDGPDLSEQAAVQRAETFTAALPRESYPAFSDEAFSQLSYRQRWLDVRRAHYKSQPAKRALPARVEGLTTPVLDPYASQSHGLPDQAVSQIEAILDDAMSRRSNFGFSICIAHRGGIVLHRAYGKDHDGNELDRDAVGNLSSVTKAIFGVLLSMYTDRGYIKLDVPIEEYLPTMGRVDLPKPLTLRHLVTHTSGLKGHYGDDLIDLDERLAETYPILDYPSRMMYSGTGYALAGKALEMVSGEIGPTMFMRSLAEPLGFSKDARFEDTHNAGHCSVLDLTRLGQMLINGGAYGDQRFMRAETVEAMKPRPLNMIHGDDAPAVWGVGMWGPHEKGKWYFSDGAFGHDGSNAFLWMDPKRELVFCVIGFRGYGGIDYQKPSRELITFLREAVDTATEQEASDLDTDGD